MSQKFFDVIVAKEYETRQNGHPEKRTAWNRVGRAWMSKSNDSMSFELYLMPNQRYVIHFKERQPAKEVAQDGMFEDAPF
jgi:hypothetical protein